MLKALHFISHIVCQSWKVKSEDSKYIAINESFTTVFAFLHWTENIIILIISRGCSRRSRWWRSRASTLSPHWRINHLCFPLSSLSFHLNLSPKYSYGPGERCKLHKLVQAIAYFHSWSALAKTILRKHFLITKVCAQPIGPRMFDQHILSVRVIKRKPK